MKNPLKLIRQRFDSRSKIRKELQNAKLRRNEAKEEVAKLEFLIKTSTNPIYENRRRLGYRVSDEEISAWREELEQANKPLQEAEDKVSQLEDELATLEAERDDEDLETIQAAYHEAAAQVMDQRQQLGALEGKIADHQETIDGLAIELRDMPIQSADFKDDELEAITATYREKKAKQDELVFVMALLKAKHQVMTDALQEAEAQTQMVKASLLQKISDEEFSPSELEVLRERVMRAWTAQSMANRTVRNRNSIVSIHSFVLGLFGVAHAYKPSFHAARDDIKRKYLDK